MKCVTKGCRKITPKNYPHCAKCRKRKQKQKNPVKYFFNVLKQNAKRRGKYFDLTLEEFRVFCEKTNYLELKGKSGMAATIDRINNELGYTANNIQILSHFDNTSKLDECPF
jgi:hypothetical protein